MARKKINDDAQYRVVLVDVVTVGRVRLTPKHDNVVSGAVLKAIPAEAISSYSEV